MLWFHFEFAYEYYKIVKFVVKRDQVRSNEVKWVINFVIFFECEFWTFWTLHHFGLYIQAKWSKWFSRSSDQPIWLRLTSFDLRRARERFHVRKNSCVHVFRSLVYDLFSILKVQFLRVEFWESPLCIFI